MTGSSSRRDRRATASTATARSPSTHQRLHPHPGERPRRPPPWRAGSTRARHRLLGAAAAVVVAEGPGELLVAPAEGCGPVARAPARTGGSPPGSGRHPEPALDPRRRSGRAPRGVNSARPSLASRQRLGQRRRAGGSTARCSPPCSRRRSSPRRRRSAGGPGPPTSPGGGTLRPAPRARTARPRPGSSSGPSSSTEHLLGRPRRARPRWWRLRPRSRSRGPRCRRASRGARPARSSRSPNSTSERSRRRCRRTGGSGLGRSASTRRVAVACRSTSAHSAEHHRTGRHAGAEQLGHGPEAAVDPVATTAARAPGSVVVERASTTCRSNPSTAGDATAGPVSPVSGGAPAT